VQPQHAFYFRKPLSCIIVQYQQAYTRPLPCLVGPFRMGHGGGIEMVVTDEICLTYLSSASFLRSRSGHDRSTNCGTQSSYASAGQGI
jgi:hypothetical protein